MTQHTSPIQLSFVLLVALVMPQVLVTASSTQNQKRAVRGQIYFSNNTPANLDEFPVELLTWDQKQIVVATTLTESGEFYLSDLLAGKYVLKISQPEKCSLLYRIDIQTRSITNIRVVMDAACAHRNGKLSDLPK